MNLQRRTFAIISHPDAGKTTITEKLLLFSGAIEIAGSVKGRKASQSARSDWMEMEKQRGISITTSVMQFEFNGCLFNLLDTPGHADFSEDTYRTLTAVDSALMVIDAVKGVEERTKKLMAICRSRNIPVITFINKLDRGAKDPLALIDEIERELNLICQPITWPIGMGRDFKGVYHLLNKKCMIYESGKNFLKQNPTETELDSLKNQLDPYIYSSLLEELSLIDNGEALDQQRYNAGALTPVYFGSALNNFGIKEILNGFVSYAPGPLPRYTKDNQIVNPDDPELKVFVFKIQANMDLQHRDRVAFCRICSGTYKRGQKIYHVESGKFLQNTQALTFLAQDRSHIEEAYPGDIIGLINHGSIAIGDTFCEKKNSSLKFKGIPRFAPEIFKAVRPIDPLKAKQLNNGLTQLSQEGATQYFKKMIGNELILGAVGMLQFDVVAHRLETEYQVPCLYTSCPYVIAYWISADNKNDLEAFIAHYQSQIALDSHNEPVFLATSRVQLQLVMERSKNIKFLSIQDS
ncbi:peptide chain release factor 3 [bacterium]|nr:peptide chain release factor 3 [bacterium]NBX71543.1 peptide chain release factor 3 [bacterium]